MGRLGHGRGVNMVGLCVQLRREWCKFCRYCHLRLGCRANQSMFAISPHWRLPLLMWGDWYIPKIQDDDSEMRGEKEMKMKNYFQELSTIGNRGGEPSCQRIQYNHRVHALLCIFFCPVGKWVAERWSRVLDIRGVARWTKAHTLQKQSLSLYQMPIKIIIINTFERKKGKRKEK